LLGDKKPTSGSGKISRGIRDNNAREKVIEFILGCLEEFKNKFKNKNPEDGLTQELVTLLDNETRISLPVCGFRQQPMENTDRGDSHRADIDVRAISGITINAKKYNDNEPFMVFEAKRLDSGLGKERKKEYVVGRIFKDKKGNNKYLNSGGMERFKQEIHGKNLTHVGMIGYMQTDDFDSWLKKINTYIDEEIVSLSSKELIWEEKDKLNIDKKEIIYQTFKSEHKCISEKNIKMYHIWVDLV
jgi:hypothetical protein